MRADIDGKPGLDYVLQPSFLPPPLPFTEEAVRALVIGARWVSRQTDGTVVLAVKNALAKIYAVFPPDMRSAPDDDTFDVGYPTKSATPVDHSEIRRALREQRNARITLSEEHALATGQVIWPIMLGFVDARRFIGRQLVKE